MTGLEETRSTVVTGKNTKLIKFHGLNLESQNKVKGLNNINSKNVTGDMQSVRKDYDTEYKET